MRKRKVFSGASKDEIQGNIAKWVAADPSILILNKTMILPKASYVDPQPGEKLIGSGDWEATVEYKELSSDAQRVTGRPLG
jgi:hypothetical protein